MYLESSLGLWIICTILPGIFVVCKNTHDWNNYNSITIPGAAIPLSAANKAAEEMTSTSFKQRTFSYPDTLISNYVDPDDIPELIKPYAETIFTSAQSIMQYHGFQVDNSRNQSEHLIMLLFNETSPIDKMVSSPALRIHSRLFKNYIKWCDSLSISPLLLKNISVVKSHDLIIEDMLLYLLIWGEAANLRHLPECLCFLFHKTMEEHIYQKGSFGATNGKYPGFYLDMVIIPIYEIISKSVTSVVDHAERKIYDDFNEFFWNIDCLKYSLRLRPTRSVDDEFHANNGERDLATALKQASKTYLEKRSWFHPIFAMNRIFEWHVVTFTILATVAFSNLLQWNNVFTLQVGSFIFWEIVFLQILWTFLEIWTIYPDVSVTDTTSCGFLIRVLTELTVLTYQTIYYHWTFAGKNNEFLKDAPNFTNGDEMYWWWQYIWLSVIALSVYFAQSIFCWFPNLSSIVLNSRNEIFQSFLSIVYPFSQLYVGKSAGVKQNEVNQYILFWVTLLSFKLWFGFQYVVSPVATPTLELYDDYMNFEKISFLKTATLMFFWWLPHFLVYIIDLSIWYAVWSSIAGGFIAITDRLGAVRDSQTFRSHFMRAPKLFYKHFMPSESSDTKDSLPSHLSTISLSEIVLRPKQEKELYRTDYSSYQNLNPMENGRSQERESKNREWIIFGRIWNEVVEKLREKDHISNREKELLLFSNFEWLSKPIYLPLYQTAGCVEMVVVTFRDAAAEYRAEQSKDLKMRIVENFYSSINATSSEALQEAWEIFAWIASELLGGIHSEDSNGIILKLNEWWKSGDMFVRLASGSTKKLLDYASQIASELRNVVNKRKRTPLVPIDTYLSIAPSQEFANSTLKPSDGNIKKSISTGFLTAFEDPNNSFTKLQPFRKGTELVDSTRDKIRESYKNLLMELKASLKGCTVLDHQIESLCLKIVSTPSGFFWNDLYASNNIDLFCKDVRASKAVAKLYDLLNLRVTEVELKSHEANRRLNFLLNSLYMDVPKIPSCRYCKEYTCITPYYSEDILLTKSDLLTVNSDNVSVLLYLQTLYKNDWTNFLERQSIDESQIWTSAHMQELRMWASCRAQTLFRTVEGMMHSEYAIRLLAELEQLSSSEVDLLSKFKFNYVVACQMYGVFKKNQDPKADDIEFLLARYPNLRVAYIDACRINNMTETAFYSVLIKSDMKQDVTSDSNNVDLQKDQIREVFRVKLPGNPVLGEGKPENQNHAIIFTRGRYLQAIDMNQDGYFEDALKMRNVLEEFNDGCVIVGFREHIFTGAVSSVANYMALQELSFVTLGQRVLHRPLKIRQHYGHPDLFDKLYVMTEGGMSKASRGINLSEDVFAGFNATIRGHSVKFVEYVQAGKGRDVGLQQTYKFEAKLAQGNAEQSLSRDMSRLGNRLDFFRLLSFYFGGLGHYLSNALVMFTLVIIVYTMLGLALYHEEGVNGRPLHPEGVFQLLLAGMGILQTLPLAVTLTVEKGFRSAVSEISFMILSGGPLYFIFHIQTKCYYFSQTLLAGGAKYRPTGRGFVTRHSPFEENFRFFASSHIYLGFELIVALVLFGFYTTSKQYGGLTWSLWLAAVSFVMGPFWFNPLSFEWSRIQDDYLSWIKWMKEMGGDSEQSWDSWWRDENDFYRKLSITWKLSLFIQKCCLWIFIAGGIAGREFFTSVDEQMKVVEVITTVIVFFIGKELLGRFERDWTYATRRFTSLLLSSVVTCFLVYLFVMHQQHFLYSIALYYFASASSFLILLSGHYNYVIKLYKFHDYVVGHFIFLILSVASILQVATNCINRSSYIFMLHDYRLDTYRPGYFTTTHFLEELKLMIF